MIEIICNEGESNNTRQDKIRRPKNIKQIGEINSNKKIYIEDYAFTFINSIAYSNPNSIQTGVLLGECQKNGEESYIFIKGAIRVRMPEDENGHEVYFNEKVWTSIYEDSEKYFHDLKIVGWFTSVPNMTKEKFAGFTKLHIDNFAGNDRTLYVIDTAEREENFYFYEDGELKKQGGYVCFYERNCEMQEYMLENRGQKSIEEPVEDRVVQSFRNILQEKKESSEQKKTNSLLYGISTFMLVVVFVIGINIMNSYEKMQSFDNSLNQIVKEISNMNVVSESNPSSQSAVQESTKEQEVTPVTKLAGNVYPTEAENKSTQEQSQTDIKQPSKDVVKEEQTIEPKTEAVVSNKIENNIIYTVVKGDTLMSICKAHYGDATKYKEVMEVNSMTNPDKLVIGQQIKLP